MTHHVGHLSVHRGKRVLVWFRDRDRPEVDVFLDRTDRAVEFARLGKVPVSRLRTISPYKGGDGGARSRPA